jgi:hypothetical protein
MIEKTRIWYEYMEVGVEGKELTGRCRLERQQQDGMVAGAGSSRPGGSGSWKLSMAAVAGADDQQVFLCASPFLYAPLPPVRGTVMQYW